MGMWGTAVPCPLFPKQQVEADNSFGADRQDSFLAAPIMLWAVWRVNTVLLLPIKAGCSTKGAHVSKSHSLEHGANPCPLVFPAFFYYRYSNSEGLISSHYHLLYLNTVFGIGDCLLF